MTTTGEVGQGITPSDWLTDIAGKLASARAAREMSQSTDPFKFHPLEYFRPNENALSRILADLVDPDGSHGQGDLFLNDFLDCFLRGRRDDLGKCYEVRTEYTTSAGRRVDVVLRFANGILGIENKPWAIDQCEQVADYLKELNRLKPALHALLYLSPDGGVPDYRSFSSGDKQEAMSLRKVAIDSCRLVQVSYPKICDWIQGCEKKCRSQRVRWFLREFQHYLRQTFEERAMEEETKVIVNEALQSPDHVAAVLAIAAARGELKRRLIVSLLDQLNRALPQGWSVATDEVAAIDVLDRWGKIQFVHGINPVRVAFEFSQGDCCGMIFGVMMLAGSDEKGYSSLKDRLAERFGVHRMAMGSEHWWPWYKSMPRPWQNWNADNNEAWRKIADGTAGKALVDELSQLFGALNPSEAIPPE